MRPRWYQTDAKLSVYQALQEGGDNPCVVLPTGSGKTIVIAEICRDVAEWGGTVLLLAHRKELLEQSEEKLHLIAPDLDVGVYSAGLGRRETGSQVLLGGIQSVYRRGCEIGKRDVVLVDEAHLIPTDGDGMYQQLLKDLHVVHPQVRVVGLTATPYRLKEGEVCGPDHFLNRVCYDAPIPQLIGEGYLSRLRSKAASGSVDTSSVSVRGGDFVGAELDALCSDGERVSQAVREIADRARGRKHVLVFCSGRDHAKAVYEELSRHAEAVAYIDGETPSGERADIIASFRDGGLDYLVNIDVLTTGFDAPNVDCVVLLRPTLSPGLYYQMVGRGLRTAPGKDDCLILDFGGNVERHGPIDKIEVGPRAGQGKGEAPAKACPECQEVVPAGVRQCVECGYEFPPPESAKHDAKPSEKSVLSTEGPDLADEPVMDVIYRVHTKRGAEEGDPQSMRVEYRIGAMEQVSEWVCVEHTGYAREKAERWWQDRCKMACPRSAREAVDIANRRLLAEPDSIVVDYDSEAYPRIKAYRLGEIPETDDVFASEGGREPDEEPFDDFTPQKELLLYDEDEIPF